MIRLTYCKIKQVFEEITILTININTVLALHSNIWKYSFSMFQLLFFWFQKCMVIKRICSSEAWKWKKNSRFSSNCTALGVYTNRIMEWGFKIVVILHFKAIKITQKTKTISIMPISNIKLFFFHDIHVSTFSSTFVSVEFPSY
jgi:hypothetical protein